MNATACSQTGCSGWAPAPELFPCGAPAAATSPCRAFVNKPLPLSHSLSVISFLQNLTHATASFKQSEHPLRLSIESYGTAKGRK